MQILSGRSNTENAQPQELTPEARELFSGTNEISDQLRKISALLAESVGDMRQACDFMAKLIEKSPGYLSPEGEQQLCDTVNRLRALSEVQPKILAPLDQMRSTLQGYIL